MDCPFCLRVRDAAVIIRENELAAAFQDLYPVSPGHTLIVPKRHEPDFFALSDPEQAAIWRLLADVRRTAASEARADGFNVGINVGMAAGQTVSHAHLHLIPRFVGDVSDPRGGVRWVIPAKAAYWETR